MPNNVSLCLGIGVACIGSRPPVFSLPTVPRRSSWIPAAKHKYTALVVDDDPDIAPLVDAALRPFHIQTGTVTQGMDALMCMQERRYDLIVLDLGMSDVDGLDVLQILREQPANREVPVLILTANGSDEALARSFGYGANEFVKKPFDLRELGMRAFRLIRSLQQPA